ncbi:BTAD domain-containing putative transcriptional regulator [Nonomuraea sp. NPDC049649]|uniref:AfsR/SARP family transcriptional regulator n=1 Tax=Nonomuraea sp. NPDC049649 TaxID=3155776 RepID=UPI00342F3F35
MGVRFRLLGPLRVEDGPEPGPAKHRALLAALLLSAGTAVPVERLISMLWGDRPPASAESVLRVYVSALRKLVGGITTVPGGYLLEVERDAVDCHRFERLVGEARQVREAGGYTEAAAGLRDALALWRGEALAGVDSAELRRSYAVPLEELRLTALEERVDLDLRLGRGGEVVGELRALVNSHPLRERAWAQLMAALHQAGRRSEALAAYQEARRVLVDELGLEPGAELREAHERVLAGEVVAPVGVPLSQKVPLNETPPDISDFTGRQAVLAWILREARGALDANNAEPLGTAGAGAAGFGGAAKSGAVGAREVGGGAPVHLVVHGPAGCGKSAVAVRAANLLEAGDGRLFAVLGDRAPGAVLEDLLRSLGWPDGAVPPTLDERVRLYRRLTSARRLVVVLDDATGETQVRPLLPTGPGSVTIVTSRSPLAGLEAARPYELGVLEPDEALEMLAAVGGRDRVAAEPEAAREIVRLCGGLPLALRIAGSRLARKTAWTVAHLAGRLGDERRRLDELSAGDLAVRGSLALGYRGLAEPERRLLCGLGAFTAPDFAPWVLGEELEPLAEAGLLQSRGLDEAGQERYGWHDLTRLFAAERLAEEGGPGPVLAARAADILDRARRARATLLPAEPGSGQTLVRTAEQILETGRLRQEARWLSAERRFLVATVGDFFRAGLYEAGLYEAAWRLAFYLTPLFELAGHHDDWHATTATGLDAARMSGHRQGEALLLRGLADLHRAEGRNDAAAAALRAAQPLVEGLELARVTLRLGLVEPRPAEAERLLRRALHVFGEAGDQRGRADGLRALGALLSRREPLEESLAAYRELGDPRGEAEALLVLGEAYLDMGETDGAVETLTRAMGEFDQIGDEHGRAAAERLVRGAHAGESSPLYGS